MQKIRSCPKCNSTKVITERSINGNSECEECGYKDKTNKFNFDLPTFKQYLKMNGKEDILKESTQEDSRGVYVAIKYNQSACDDLLDFINKYKIPSTLKAEYFHTTLIYSRKWADIKELDDDMEDSEIVAKPKELHVFETFDKKRALVIKLDCPYLDERHNYLMQKYDLTYDYDEYIAHITLSYDIGDLDIPKDVEFPKFFRIQSEYQEDLNLEKKY
jgi:DNA-directed RNA polymerase subunit M/transcription elongation factor TFIIS